MRWDFHDFTVQGDSNSVELMTAWQRSFASRPPSSAEPDITIRFELIDTLPPTPQQPPDFQQGDLLHYYVDGSSVIAHFPRFGQLHLDLANGTTQGQLLPAVLHTYGVLEDVVAISLSPHLRRRGYFLLHAFAAVYAGKGVLLVGGIGAGKTTTGMSLLNAGWQLLSNDSPIIAADGQILSYPGVLAGYPDTFARFERTVHLATQTPTQAGRKKLLVDAESVFSNVWRDRAPIGAICFPQIEAREAHAMEPLSLPEALRLLLPHAVEQWDRPMIPRHLSILRQLVSAAPAYRLKLAPDVLTIPDMIASVLG